MREKIIRSSGNVFADLGLDNSEELLRKANVALVIKKLIEKRNLNQAEAAARMRMGQSDVSKIIRGKLGGYSLERLLDGVSALGSRVEIKIKDKETGRTLMRT